MAAAAAGFAAEQAIDTLNEASTRALPDNVRREVEGWFAECRHVTLATTLLVRCPDADTAARVLGAAGKAARPISDTVVELVDRTRARASSANSGASGSSWTSAHNPKRDPAAHTRAAAAAAAELPTTSMGQCCRLCVRERPNEAFSARSSFRFEADPRHRDIRTRIPAVRHGPDAARTHRVQVPWLNEARVRIGAS